MADLREADGLLQRAIEKVDDRNKVDTAQVRHACRLSGGDAFRVFAPPGPCQRLVFFVGCRRCSSALRSRGV